MGEAKNESVMKGGWPAEVEVTSTTTELAFEWIVEPTRTVLEQLTQQVRPLLDQRKPNLSILEIGSGTSTLARDWWIYLREKRPDIVVHMTATDVSPVCIEQLLVRDEEYLSPEKESTESSLSYQVLNVIDANPELSNQFDIILDKSCLDTILFRTKLRQEKQVNVLVGSILNNVCSWLKKIDAEVHEDTVPTDDSKSSPSLYVLLTPRARFKPVRDYPGFYVSRLLLEESQLACLKDRFLKRVQNYLYVCYMKKSGEQQEVE